MERIPITIKSVKEDEISEQVIWSYSGYDKSIIEVTADGQIKAKKAGDTVVVVKGTFVSPLGRKLEEYALVNVVVYEIETAEDGVLYAISDKFSQYAVAYIDTLLPKAPDTGVRASEGASATSSLAALVAGVLAMITLAGVAVFTKRK